MKKRCPKCHAEMPENAKFCHNCGSPLSKDSPVIVFQGATIIGDVVNQKIVREPDGSWEYKEFYIDLKNKDGQYPRIWEMPYPGIRKSLWYSVKPFIMRFVNTKSAAGWTLDSNLGNYDEFLLFQDGTDKIRWVAEFLLKMSTGGLTSVNAYWTEVRGASIIFKRKVRSSH